jgi:hypothetical protein
MSLNLLDSRFMINIVTTDHIKTTGPRMRGCGIVHNPTAPDKGNAIIVSGG